MVTDLDMQLMCVWVCVCVCECEDGHMCVGDGQRRETLEKEHIWSYPSSCVSVLGIKVTACLMWLCAHMAKERLVLYIPCTFFPRKPIWVCISNVWTYRKDFCMFLEDVYIITWETDVNIKEKGCVSTKLKVCEKCLKWSRNCSRNSWRGLQPLVPFLFISLWRPYGLDFSCFHALTQVLPLSTGIVGAPGFAEAILSSRSFVTLRYWFPLKWMI